MSATSARADRRLQALRQATETWAAEFPRVIFLKHLALLLGGSVDSFTGQLLQLCAQADPGNLANLQTVYPDVVLAYRAWHGFDPPPTPAELWDKVSELAEAEL